MTTARFRGEHHQFRNRLDAAVQVVRLCVVTDAFLAQVAYRARVRCRGAGVPLLPWLGVVWLGVWAGSALLRLAPALRDWQADGVWAVLALLGRRSLLYYMLHQPVMIGSLWLLKTLAA